MSRQDDTYTEAKSQAELSSTEVSRGTAIITTWVFLLLISILPLAQGFLEISSGETPQIFSLFHPLQQAWAPARAGHWSLAWQALRPLFDRRALGRYEKALDQQSIARRFVQPRLQAFLTSWLGVGNEKGIVGRDGWLYYQPGLDYLTGPNFVDERELLVRAKRMVDKEGETEPYPDPRPALLQFQRDLARGGIRLVVFPAPDKAMLQPVQLARRMGGQEEIPVPNNRGYRRFVKELQQAGVDVFDPVPVQVRRDQIRFLRQDSHWTPEYMDAVASQLAEYLKSQHGLAPSPEAATFAFHPRKVSRVGDLVDMLKLPEGQQIFQPQTVTIQQVVDARTGQPWKASSEADILLLGDSYTNIYSSNSLGWGTNAGFAEHLSYQLHRPLDVMAVNGSGATGIRRELARPENLDRLANKRVVVYQFAIRDLAVENWVPIPMTIPARAAIRGQETTATPALHAPALAGAAVSSAADMEAPMKPAVSEKLPSAGVPVSPMPVKPTSPGQELIITGTVQKVSALPEPSSAPYPDCLTFTLIHIDGLESGQYADKILIAVFLGMKDNKWLAPAHYRPGDRLRLQLIPMKQAPEEIRATQRVDDLDDFSHIPYYVISGELL
jgi:hypothetical protein